MRDLFRGYYHPTQEEWDATWRDGLIVLDANILVSMYNVHEDTSALYLEAMEKRQEQMWIPYQVAAEFHRNAHKERAKQTSLHTERIGKIKHLLDHFRSTDKKTRLYAAPPSQEEALAGLETLKQELYEQRKQIEKQTHHNVPDALLNRIAEVFATGVGEEPKASDMETMLKDGAERFEKKTPPGYKDGVKKDDRQYGDYILWRQLMNHAKEAKKDVIFVTDDDKIDWWLKGENGTSLAPRPELIHEFRLVTGQLIIIMNSQLFYKTLVPNTNDGSTESQRVTAAQADMEAAVLAAREESARQNSVHSALRRFNELYPIGNQPWLQTLARKRIEDMASVGIPLDDQALRSIMQAAMTDDLERSSEEARFLTRHRLELEEELQSVPEGSPVWHEVREKIQEVAWRLEQVSDRITVLSSYNGCR